MKATTVTAVLIGVLVVLALSIIGGCVLAASMLSAKATDATHAVIDADISNDGVARVLALDKYLKDNAGLVEQTAQISGSIGQYQQNTIIATVSEYARQAGIGITGFNFGTATAGTTAVTPAGEISMTINSPVDYRNFIVFLRLLENGVMPVTVTGAVVSPDAQNRNSVNVGEMKIKVAN